MGINKNDLDAINTQIDTGNYVLIAIDPGGKRNGLATFTMTENASALNSQVILSYNNMLAYLDSLTKENCIAHIVIEDFIIRPGKNHGSRGETIKIIANAESTARRLGINITKQRPENRLIGAKWSGTTVPKSHMPDDMSAYLHGIFWLRQYGKYTTKLERITGR